MSLLIGSVPHRATISETLWNDLPFFNSLVFLTICNFMGMGAFFTYAHLIFSMP